MIPSKKRIIAEYSLVVNCHTNDLFNFCRNFENLPEIFTQIREIQVISPIRTRWFAVAPVGSAIEWEVDILTESADEWIAWHSIPGSAMVQEGQIRFEPMADDGQTRMTVSIRYGSASPAISELLPSVFGKNPAEELARDLNRFQQRLLPRREMVSGTDSHFPLLAGFPRTGK